MEKQKSNSALGDSEMGILGGLSLKKGDESCGRGPSV